MFDGTGKTIVKDLTGVSLKTTAALKATVSAGAITSIVTNTTEHMNTIAETGHTPEIYFSGKETLYLRLSEKEGISETELQVDNNLFSGRMKIDGRIKADKIFLENVRAETVVRAGGGDDVITVGGQGLIDNIGASLFLFGQTGSDTILIDDSADLTSRDVEIDKTVLKHTNSFEQLSRITDALGLKGITAAENAQLEVKLKEAAVPYGQKAMNVDEADLVAYRDFAADGLLDEIDSAATNLETELNTAITDTVATSEGARRAIT